MSRLNDSDVHNGRRFVLVLQHAACEALGRIEPALQAEGLAPKYIRVFDGDPVPAEIGGAAALIVMGGPMSVYEQEFYPFLTGELKLIKSAVAAGRPVLGICLGSQLLAAALGGAVTPGPEKEIGWYPIQLEEDPLFKDLPSEFPAFHWHGDIFSLPPGAIPLAHSALTQHQAFRFGTNVYGLLFHLEVTEPLIDGMVANFGDELDAAAVDRHALASDTVKYMPGLQVIGEQVFARWAKLAAR